MVGEGAEVMHRRYAAYSFHRRSGAFAYAGVLRNRYERSWIKLEAFIGASRFRHWDRAEATVTLLLDDFLALVSAWWERGQK